VLALGPARTAAAQRSTVADAAERRDDNAVIALIKRGASVDTTQPDGATALHWAAHWDDDALAMALVRAGATPNVANDYGITPLILAATNGSARMIRTLLQAGADPNAATRTGQTPVMMAARTGNVTAVEALIAAGASLNATQRSKGQSALMWAIAQHHPDVTRLLIERGADVNARTLSGFTPLLFAAREGDLETVKLLIAKGVDVNESAHDGSTPVLVATARGHVNLALFLLDNDARADGNLAVFGYTPLHWAATTFETNPLTYPGLQPPGEWEAMNGIPDRNGKLDLIKALVAHGADVNARTAKPLLNQAPPGGGSFSYAPGRGATPFFCAAASADADVMRLLVGLGADPLLRSANNETPLIIATAADIDISFRLTEPKRLDAVQLAWELGNDLEAADNRGHRAMHLAARSGYHDIITWLVQHGADLNPKTKPRQELRTPGQPFANVQPQTPLGLVEGSVYTNFFERPATAEFLRNLGAKSEGRFSPLGEEPRVTEPAATTLSK
jgi:ankyrin repeat protein